MTTKSSYDKLAIIPISSTSEECAVGWESVLNRLLQSQPGIVCIECYPGVFEEELVTSISTTFQPAQVFRTNDFFKSPAEIQEMVTPYLTGDPVFGRMNSLQIEDFLDPDKLTRVREQIRKAEGRILIIGTGAALLVSKPDVLVYADLARWEIQQRQRKNQISNLGVTNDQEPPSLKYKRAFFIDWRSADRLKKEVFPKMDFLLDTHVPSEPKLIPGETVRKALRTVASRPFRVVPFFDPGPWGGQWMRSVCDLPAEAPNYAWCFDCVPEENSLCMGFGATSIEIPALDLVFFEPERLLGESVYRRFGAEFPIRFDFLDTIEGGNLSLQVHPLTNYIQDQFAMKYTQDESYYLLDAKEDAGVFLGLKQGINPDEMLKALEKAQQGGAPFPAERFVNRWPAKKHDHFLIPAGTIHCSGRNSMVLEISATPYIFTFKLWDWNRLDLEGKPRPIHLEHGRRNLQWDRDTDWVRQNLVNRVEKVSEGEGWSEERTGLHKLEFIETRRHWFTAKVPHDTQGNVNVLNLVEGPEVVVESPQDNFAPFVVHYAETFIVPGAVGRYTIRPARPGRCATIKAYVRTTS
jgi:mannose-6-phosphate isomerase class I